MRNKKIILRIIDIIFTIDILANALIILTKGVLKKEIMFSLDLPDKLTPVMLGTMMTSIAFLILFSVVIALFKKLYIVCIYIGTRLAFKKLYKEKLNADDLKKDKVYYRDIIKKYSPAVLGYTDDLKVDEEEIVAAVLSLKLKKKIEITDELKVIDETTDGLDLNEKYILKNIKANTTASINVFEFERLVKEDAKKEGLVEDKQFIRKNIIIKIIVSVLIFIAITLAPNILLPYINNILINNELLVIPILSLTMLFMFIFIAYPIAAIIYIVTYFKQTMYDNNIRTKKGIEINKNLEGLKNFLKDFSLLKDKSEEQLALWEDYLVYSVVFGQNKNILEDIDKKLKG